MSVGLQGRLTAWYAAALLVALAIGGGGLYLSVLRLELGSVDDDLQSAASTVAFGMKAEQAENLDLRAAAVDTAGELRIAGMALALYNLNGSQLAARWEDFDANTIRPADLREGMTTVRSGGKQWRRLITRQKYGNIDYLVLNALRLDAVMRHTALVRTAFLAFMPIMFALAVGGGWLLARSTLRPVIESQRRFMAEASHELRTPVSVIRSAADVTLSRPNRSAAEYQDSINIIAEQAKRLSRLVDDLFLLARTDVQGRPLATTRFYLDDVLSECVRATELLGTSKQVCVDVASDKDVEIEADEDLLRRMLMNLLENAVRYSPNGARVRVALKQHNGLVEISVGDKGPGIPNEDRERIFERFVRLESKRAGGAGLGLPIARWIAEAHAGALTLAESSPSGSVFVVRLPVSTPTGGSLG